jgi:hypothetical protein
VSLKLRLLALRSGVAVPPKLVERVRTALAAFPEEAAVREASAKRARRKP